LTLLTLGITVGAIASTNAPLSISTLVLAQEPAPATSFPDIQNHWARPFIEALVEKDIVAGYPDGTFRPNKTIDRDEFAAVIRGAFDGERVRKYPDRKVLNSNQPAYRGDIAAFVHQALVAHRYK
jgi:S-layer homology domain